MGQTPKQQMCQHPLQDTRVSAQDQKTCSEPGSFFSSYVEAVEQETTETITVNIVLSLQDAVDTTTSITVELAEEIGASLARQLGVQRVLHAYYGGVRLEGTSLRQRWETLDIEDEATVTAFGVNTLEQWIQTATWPQLVDSFVDEMVANPANQEGRWQPLTAEELTKRLEWNPSGAVASSSEGIQGKIKHWDLSGLGIKCLPAGFAALNVTGDLNLRDNDIRELPDFGKIRVGGWLALQRNRLQRLPKDIGAETVRHGGRVTVSMSYNGWKGVCFLQETHSVRLVPGPAAADCRVRLLPSGYRR